MKKEKKSGAELVEDRPQERQSAPRKGSTRKQKAQGAPIAEGKPTRSAPTGKKARSGESAPTAGDPQESREKGAELTRQEGGAEIGSGIEGEKSLQAGGNREGEKDGLLDKLDSTKKRRLLQHYINSGGQVYKSCRFAGIHPQTHYNWLANDPDYKAAYALAQERSLDVIEQEIIRRGVKGHKEPIIYQGKITGHVRRYSDNLLMFLAKRRDPLYRDNPQLALGLKAAGDVKIAIQIPRPDQGQTVDAEAREVTEK